MAERSVLTCADCGTPMARAVGSLPQGQATCQPCRRIRRGIAADVARQKRRDSATRLAGCGHRIDWHEGLQRRCCPACMHPERTCRVCGADITGRRRDARFCSAFCSEVQRGERLPEPLEPVECALAECPVVFVPAMRLQRCCSERHGKLHHNRVAREAAGPRHDPWTDARRDAYHRRRALIKGAATGEPVNLADIAERDGWRCGLCDEPIEPALEWPHPASKSLDHVVPLSKGGRHDPSNVQLAHLRCNTVKGARLVAS
jgi:5-methylcytosine-specific restriction endonuclease McrA